MIDLINNTSLQINEDILNNILGFLTTRDVELLIVSEDEIRNINLQQRNIDRSTDVLSFPLQEMHYAPLGSIVISEHHIKKKAKELKHTQSDECSLLFIHGLLHLLGFDHEVDDGQMRDKEEILIKKFNLPNSLIVRTQG